MAYALTPDEADIQPSAEAEHFSAGQTPMRSLIPAGLEAERKMNGAMQRHSAIRYYSYRPANRGTFAVFKSKGGAERKRECLVRASGPGRKQEIARRKKR
jgi:hypothetical protein